MRIILYTGKGGVGKTTISSATAVRCAELGYKTILMSTDIAHSLSDVLDQEVGHDLVPVTENLWAQEIDVNEELKTYWGPIQDFITTFLKKQGLEGIIAEEFAVFPGTEEMFSLMKINQYYESKEYDVVIVDCAPTGATIRMLSFPDILKWYMQKLFNLERKLVKAVRPIAERIAKISLPTDDVYVSFEAIYRNVGDVKDILMNPRETSIRIVCNSERMIIKESQRAYTYLNLFGYPVDSVVVNRLLPPEARESYLQHWQITQEKHLKEVEEAFNPLPIFHAKFFNREISGLKDLSMVAEDTYGEVDPAKNLFQGKPMEIKQRGNSYYLSLRLPFVSREKLDMWVRGDELILQVGNFKRNIFLPRTLIDKKIREAEFLGNTLRIIFEGNQDVRKKK